MTGVYLLAIAGAGLLGWHHGGLEMTIVVACAVVLGAELGTRVRA